MKLGAEKFHLDLAEGEVLGLEATQAVEVACEEGRVWITEEGHRRDVWLTAGQRARLSGCGLAVLEAVRNARIRIGTPVLVS